MDTAALLEARHTTYLEWVEPHRACGPEGNEMDANVTLRCTVHDAINLARIQAKLRGHPTMGGDAQHLLDFIAVYWASVV